MNEAATLRLLVTLYQQLEAATARVQQLEALLAEKENDGGAKS